ncbi:MAG: hypothetical protein V4503_06325 [Gemmatimonadota bacterium]
MTATRSLLAAALLLSAVTHAPSQAPNPCAGQAACTEVPSFVATVTDFRTSSVSYYKVVTATVRLRNKLNRPLILGYVAGSGIATDDQGHRFEVTSATGVRGIGVISNNTFDSKFILQPGESSDARIEMSWRPANRNEIFGTSWVMEFSIREIDPIAGNQFRLGREHALQFRGFRDGWVPTTTVASAPPPAAAAAPTAAAAPGPDHPPAEASDPCAGNVRCYNAGQFIAEVRSLTPGATNVRHHTLDVGLRVRNVTNAPIILGYKSGSSGAIDNLGNRYVYGRPGTHDVNFKGIGLITSAAADPQFVLQPGQSRDISFIVVRFNSLNQQIGTSWSYEVTLTGLEVLPSRQLRESRDYVVAFHDLGSRASAAATVKSAKELMDEVKARLKRKPQ